MNERERERPERPLSGGDAAGGDGLDGARSGAERMLRAADDAIARALSSDSPRFLRAIRQSGGQ